MEGSDTASGSKALSVQLGDVTAHNLQQFKLLNVASLPVRFRIAGMFKHSVYQLVISIKFNRYTDKFYKDLLIRTPKNLIKFGERVFGENASNND